MILLYHLLINIELNIVIHISILLLFIILIPQLKFFPSETLKKYPK